VDKIEPFSVIAFDPGGTTGIAYAHYDGEEIHYQTGELGPHEHHDELWNVLEHWHHEVELPGNNKHLVTESFEFRQNLQKKNVELISKEYIGIMKLFAINAKIKYFERNASQAKSFVSDEKLDRLGILEVPKHPNRHRNDALRHLIMYLVVNLGIQSPITNQWRN
jgi:hypothetical protein